MQCPLLTFILYEITFFKMQRQNDELFKSMYFLLSLAVTLSVCKEAKADLTFLVDGSWSIGDDNFMKITRFLYSTVGSLDLIGPDGTQVSHVATPRLSLHHSSFSQKHYEMGNQNVTS